jgi:Nickel responsive protein SCO4226-like
MPRYVIEREMPGVGKLSADELRGAAVNSNGVLAELGPDIQWVESYVTGDKIYCVYIAENEELVRQHAQQAGFPANKVSAVAAVISPITAEG